MTELYADDLTRGDEFEYGSHTVTEGEIVEFAEAFDPQPFHVDPDAAADSMFGGLVASGWHVAALTNRLLTDALFDRLALRGGRGVDEVRFENPVRPGDTLSGTIRVASLGDQDGRGSRDVIFETETRTDEGEAVLSMRIRSIVGQQPEQ
jgi:acyl dehydratase